MSKEIVADKHSRKSDSNIRAASRFGGRNRTVDGQIVAVEVNPVELGSQFGILPEMLIKVHTFHRLRLSIVALHLVCWVFYASVSYYFAYLNKTPFLLAHPSVFLLGQAAVFYVNFYYWIPGLLAGRRFPQFFACNLFLAAGLDLLLIPMFHWIRARYFGMAQPFHLSMTTQVVLRSLEFFFVVFLAAIARFSNDWFVHQKRARELENAHLKTELAFLRAQINPHFLFNTLNSLYALAIKRSDHTAPAIMQLSGLMRYHLDGNEERPRSLRRELEVLGNYIDLQKLRLPRGFALDFTVSGSTDGPQIPPLLLLPLVENAFKHGADFITISVMIRDQKLTLSTQNGVNKYLSVPPSGIGLVNLRKRLDYLFPGKSSLRVQRTNGRFDALLEIPLFVSPDEIEMPGC
ncbi:MAG: sensor histidine kinase [Dyadobacter sp.]|uniref:sensor histidine kinase n=1 Tax=Dyadobacter sp. TaxID=1914288 RepID=UPI001B06B4B2|nr:sensor histidine kinase [Dyadobacter sp.]MBO9611145.1 sensor histidine kinase [Dyadobacter sp.]